ncbi:MAG TPA: DUF2442 domain-containing protein [Terracidiphilus sp.]|nr:DUF2442 domain-containing protein [Terracidiphilus sp.]
MSSSVNAKRVRFSSDSMWIELSNGHVLGVPLAWFPRLRDSTPEQRERVRITSRGLHWDALDEDISIASLLAGFGDQSTKDKRFAGSVTISCLAGWPLRIASYDRCPSNHWAILPHSVV